MPGLKEDLRWTRIEFPIVGTFLVFFLLGLGTLIYGNLGGRGNDSADCVTKLDLTSISYTSEGTEIEIRARKVMNIDIEKKINEQFHVLKEEKLSIGDNKFLIPQADSSDELFCNCRDGRFSLSAQANKSQ